MRVALQTLALFALDAPCRGVIDMKALERIPRPSGVMSSKPQSGLAKSPERWCWPGGDFEKLISLPQKWRISPSARRNTL